MSPAPVDGPVLEAVTIIRIPPPGLEAGYAVAVVREGPGLHAGRLLLDGPDLPLPGTPLRPVDSPVAGIPAYRTDGR